MSNICEKYVGFDEFIEHERWKSKDTDDMWHTDYWKTTYIRDRFVQQLMDNVLFETETHPLYIAIVRSAIQEYILNRMPDEDIYHHVMNDHFSSPMNNAVGVDTGRWNCCRHDEESCSHMVHEETLLKDEEKQLLKSIESSRKFIKRLQSNPKRNTKPIWSEYETIKKTDKENQIIQKTDRELKQIETQKENLVKMKQRNMRGYDKG